MTLFEMKEKLATLNAAIAADAAWIAEKVADPDTQMPEVEAKQKHRDELVTRRGLLQKEHDSLEEQQRNSVAFKFAATDAQSGELAKKAKGDFYKAVLTGATEDSIRKAYTALGGIPAGDADLGYGDKLLPTNMSNELITEPAVENPMREIVRLSNVTGLEEPKLLFDVDGAYDNVTDKDTAKEIKAKGDTVVYGRNKVKVLAKVSDTVLRGAPYDLAATIDNALRSGLAANEMARMFAPSPASPYDGMSFYSSANAVKHVTGSTVQKAIAGALADIPLAYRRNAKIVMSSAAWFDMWEANLNRSGMFYEERPLTLFGKDVVLVDDATLPIVGDFSYARINYDIGTVYDTDKDIEAGIYRFVLTAWYDIKLRLSSAFRIAEVVPGP
jgi:HK97 family phage major capsid protein